MTTSTTSATNRRPHQRRKAPPSPPRSPKSGRRRRGQGSPIPEGDAEQAPLTPTEPSAHPAAWASSGDLSPED